MPSNRLILQRPSRIAIALASLAATGLITSCGVTTPGAAGTPADCKRSTQKVIGWDFPLSTLDVYRTLNSAVVKAADSRGYQVRTTANNGDLQQQVSDVETWVTQGLPAVATYALEPSSMEAVAAEAKSKCVGFVSYGTDMKNQDAAVEFDWKGSGTALGQTALAWAKTKNGPVKALILNDRDISAGALRDDGTTEAFPAGDPNITVVGNQKANDRQSGERVTATVLQANPDLNMVLAYNDDVALGARQAFLNAGHASTDPDVWVGGQDGSAEALKILQNGDDIFRTSVALNMQEVGERVAFTTIDIAEGKKPDYPPLEGTPLTAADGPKVGQYLSVQVTQ